MPSPGKRDVDLDPRDPPQDRHRDRGEREPPDPARETGTQTQLLEPSVVGARRSGHGRGVPDGRGSLRLLAGLEDRPLDRERDPVRGGGGRRTSGRRRGRPRRSRTREGRARARARRPRRRAHRLGRVRREVRQLLLHGRANVASLPEAGKQARHLLGPHESVLSSALPERGIRQRGGWWSSTNPSRAIRAKSRSRDQMDPCCSAASPAIRRSITPKRSPA